jgi:hypothetical protein
MRFPKSAIKSVQILGNKPRNLLPFPIAVGQITENIDATTREVKVLKMEMNDYLKMYFNKSYVFQSVDLSGVSRKGDIVLVRKLEKPPSQKKQYGIEKILFKIDDLVDPVTGKKLSDEAEALKQNVENLSKVLSQ